MERKIIYFGDIIVKDGRNKKTIIDAVFLEDDTTYKGMEITEIISKKAVGMTSASKQYTEVKASNEKRNNITGAYE